MGRYNVAVCGAFDVVSYGDSLFPIAVENELKKRIEKMGCLILFAPKGTEQLYSNGQRVYSYSDIEKMHEVYHFDLIIIGGGELLHFNPILFYEEDGSEIYYEPGELWRRPADFARTRGIPYVINSVGAPNSFSKEEESVLSNCLGDACYISVRDRFSYFRLMKVVPDSICVPDSLWNLKRYVRSESLLESKYMVIQYGTLFQVDELMTVIQKIQGRYAYQIVVLPVNYCHDDRVIAERARKVLSDSALIYDRQLGVHEIFNIIAGAALFIGTSLHGTLTALINKVPSIIIDMYPSSVGKMDGIYDWLAGGIPMISDVNSLMDLIPYILEQRQGVSDDIICDLMNRTDMHFDKMAQCLYGGREINEK